MKELMPNVPLPAGYDALYTKNKMLDYAQACVTAYRLELRDKLLRMHEKSKNNHNYYACLAREIEDGLL